MLITKAARRYATALLEIAKELDKVEEVLSDMKLINNTLSDSKELVSFLRSPVIKYDDKSEALETIFGDKVQEISARFMHLLSRKSRISLLDQIAAAFLQKYNKYAGIIKVDVYTARQVDEAQKQKLQSALEQKTSKKVDMNITVDETLKGGVTVRIDDTVIDGSVKHKLEELEQQFLAAAIES